MGSAKILAFQLLLFLNYVLIMVCQCNITIDQSEKCLQKNETKCKTSGDDEDCVKREKSDGSCISYNGGVCSAFLANNTFGNSTTTLRYVDNKLGVNKTNLVFTVFLNALNRTGDSSSCKNYISLSLCRYGIPNCLHDDFPQQICREDCEYVLSKCSEDVAQFIGAVKYITVGENINFQHLVIPASCNRFNFSYDNQNSNRSCQYVIAGIDRTRPVKKKSPLVIVIIASSVFLIVVIIIFLLMRKRLLKSKKNKFVQKTSYQELNTMTSIRDHIRDNAFNNNPLQELLANAKPGEIIQYPLDCVEYIRDLGEGQFGKVFQGRIHGIVKEEENTDVAVKCLKQGSSLQALEAFNKEVQLMSVLKHSNILRLLAVSTEEEPFCMIFEFMENGDLNEYLRKCKNKDILSDSDLIVICKHIASGMNYLASKKFVHRDLATRNCLVGKDLLVKIADFGMSRDIYQSEYYRVGGEALLPIRWMPPEAILYGKFTVATDIFSFGVTMWEVFTFGMQPFYGYTNEEVVEFIKKGVLLPKPDDCPQWIYDIMIKCWKHVPEERILFTSALKLLNGQFDNYDVPEQEEDFDFHTSSLTHETYDSVPNRVDQGNSTYDVIPKRNDASIDVVEETSYYNTIAIKESADCRVAPDKDFSDYKISNDDEKLYCNVIKHGTEAAHPSALPSPHYQNYQPSSKDPPLKEQGVVNPVYDKEINSEFSNNSKSTESVATKKLFNNSSVKALKVPTKNDSKQGGQNQRAQTLANVRSIKDVLNEADRYVKGDKMRKTASLENSNP